MSKRRRRDPEPARGVGGRPDQPEAPGTSGRRGGLILRDVLVLAAAFGIGVGVAELFGAANLGVAFGVGQLVFAIVLVVLLTRD
jgi:hypothetical protein